jgi:hypothetical protein
MRRVVPSWSGTRIDHNDFVVNFCKLTFSSERAPKKLLRRKSRCIGLSSVAHLSRERGWAIAIEESPYSLTYANEADPRLRFLFARSERWAAATPSILPKLRRAKSASARVAVRSLGWLMSCSIPAKAWRYVSLSADAVSASGRISRPGKFRFRP